MTDANRQISPPIELVYGIGAGGTVLIITGYNYAQDSGFTSAFVGMQHGKRTRIINIRIHIGIQND
jgi:hypothetical protein